MPTAMFTADELAVIRRAYAHQVVATAATTNPRIEAAFATVPREKFLGAPPWQIANLGGGYRPLPSSDLVLAYQDVLLALQPDKGVNNGSPSLHARLLAELDIQIGDRIAHIGAGTGYCSAILSELVGASGHVYAVEMDPDLAAHAQAALADRANVSVINADGSQWPQEEVDAIYVNFAVARPAEPWIERLRPGGPSCCHSAYRARTDRRKAAVTHPMVLHFVLSAASVDLRRVGSAQPISSAPMVD